MTPYDHSRDLLVVAANYATAKYYAVKFGEPNARVATSVDGLRGISTETHVVYVNDDGGGWPLPAPMAASRQREVEHALHVLAEFGVTVDALGGWTYKHG